MKKFKLLLLCAVVALGVMTSCKHDKAHEDSAAAQSVAVEEETPVVDETAKLSGAVGKYGVGMKINCVDTKITGHYYYTRYPNGRLYLNGTLDHDGRLVLDEVGDNGVNTGHFDGYFSPTKGYKGVFTNYKGQTFTFMLNVNSIKPTEE